MCVFPFLPLLHNVRELMCQQVLAFAGFRLISVLIEINIVAMGKCLGINLPVHLFCVAIIMNAYTGKVFAKSLFHVRLRFLRQGAPATL